MLTRIKLENFKCFRELDLKCAPLTLLTGINGTGKSSVFQALLLTRELQLNESLARGLGGSLPTTPVSLENADDFVHTEESNLSVGLDFDNFESLDEKPYYWTTFHASRPSNRLIYETDWDANFYWWEQGLYTFPPFSRLAHVNSNRLGPQRYYDPPQSEGDDYANFGETAWHHLNRHNTDVVSGTDWRTFGTEDLELIDTVNEWLEQITPGTAISLSELATSGAVMAEFEFMEASLGISPRYNATNVGFGLSYTLPVVVSLLLPKGFMCLIENPEAHLHPGSQSKMAELAARAAKAGVQVMVETHSDHFIDGVRIAVREGILSPDDVAIHYFERQGNESVVRSPVIDSDGRLSEWPAGFFDQHEMNLVRLLRPIQGS